jgi:hypothetical protein
VGAGLTKKTQGRPPGRFAMETTYSAIPGLGVTRNALVQQLPQPANQFHHQAVDFFAATIASLRAADVLASSLGF